MRGEPPSGRTAGIHTFAISSVLNGTPRHHDLVRRPRGPRRR
jgi:hypothetical protein